MTNRTSLFLFSLLLLLCACFTDSHAQEVIITPPRFQSFLPDGANNAFGCVWTYVSGTTTPQATYTDYTGATINPNPVPLDASGSANIWLISGQLYTIVVKSQGGINCAAGTTLSSTDGMNQSLLNLSNTWDQTQYFLMPIYLEPADSQIIFGWPSGTQTTLDIPPTSANYILHGPTITANDTLVSQNAVQTLTNKTLTNPIVNGCGILGGVGTYLCLANNASLATILNSLAIATGSPSTASAATTTTVSGVLGVVVGGAGITGTATIQQSGPVNCTFDGAAVAGDFVSISTTVGGDCHDAGVAPSPGEQAIGQILVANGGSGPALIDLYSSGILTPITSAVLVLPNYPVTGTLLYGLVKQTGAPTSAVRTATTDSVGAVGIALSGAGTTGDVNIQQLGPAMCVFDGATTANDYIVISSTTAGNCHDLGLAPPAPVPTNLQVLGQTLSTNGSSGTYPIDLWGPALSLSGGNFSKIEAVTYCASGCTVTGTPCTTSSSANNTCTNTISWPSAFADANYSASCSGVASGSIVPYLVTNSKAAASVTVATSNGQGSAAISLNFSEIDCTGVHP